MSRKAKAEPPWIFLDHTADIRMEVHGKTMEELFSNAARGMMSLLVSRPSGDAETEITVHLDSGDYEDLLVDWLREILFYYDAEGFVLSEARVDALSQSALQGRLLGTTLSSEELSGEMEIKAVTYHGLAITRHETGFSAQVVLDI
jgi:SHS2 domain-containing protein